MSLAVTDLVSGTNCSVLLKKGLGSVLSAMCSFDPENPSLLSSFLDISFYQLLITVLVSLGIFFSFCFKRYALDAVGSNKEVANDS